MYGVDFCHYLPILPIFAILVDRCPFPAKIKEAEFEQIRSVARASGKFSEDKLAYLEEPYWKLDISCDPQIYVLQPISSMPGCGAYLISGITCLILLLLLSHPCYLTLCVLTSHPY